MKWLLIVGIAVMLIVMAILYGKQHRPGSAGAARSGVGPFNVSPKEVKKKVEDSQQQHFDHVDKRFEEAQGAQPTQP